RAHRRSGRRDSPRGRRVQRRRDRSARGAATLVASDARARGHARADEGRGAGGGPQRGRVMTALAILVVLALPATVVLGLLRLATVLERRREQVIARQVALTDAIHGVIGPVVAPVVRRGRGGWIGVLAVPAGHPEL